MPKPLTVSQLLGRGQLTPWETRSHRPLSPPHWGEGRQEGPEGPGLPEGERSAALRGLGRAGQGKVFAWHWAGPSPVWESRKEGILVRTAFLARRASTSKSRLKKGSRAVLKPGWAPQSLRFSPRALQPSGRTLAPLVVCWARHHLYYEAGAGEEMPPRFSEHRGVRGARRRANRAACSQLDQSTPHQPPTRHPSHPCRHHLSTTVRGGRGNQG